MSHTTTTRETTTTEYDEMGRIVRQLVVTVETVREDPWAGIDRTVYESHEWTSDSDVDRCARCFTAWDNVDDVCSEAK